jgi:hypothetical protein
MSNPVVELYHQRLEIGRVAVSAAVVAGSITLDSSELGDVLAFDIASEPTVNEPAADIRSAERIRFVYRDGRRFGVTAPSHVECVRDDFPRDLVHLCSTGPGGPAAPCLALGGLQPLYERAGIEALLERLRKFLRDAKTGTLTTDGWEPVPFAVGQVPSAGELVPHIFQDHAHANLAGGNAVGMSLMVEAAEASFVNVFPQILNPADMLGALAHHNDGTPRAVPWVFLWPTAVVPESDPIFDDWKTGAELYAGMTRIGVNHSFDAVVGDLLNRGLDFRCVREPVGGKGLVVVLGIWRPMPIMPEFFGYSENPEARRLELRAFRVTQDWDKAIVAPDTRVETIVGDYPAGPELYRWVAGVDPIAPIALIGAGALGSAVFENLVRSGLADAAVFDSDQIRPHNLTRHTAKTADLYRSKVKAASDVMGGLARPASFKFAGFERDVVEMPLDDLAGAVEDRIVLDMTADEQIRLRMDALRDRSRVTVIRSEIFHEGRLGVTFVSPADGPRLADMMRMLLAAAPDDAAVAAWLEHEEMHPLGPDPLLAGFGCMSQTVHLPMHVVEQHASVATATLLEDRDKAGIAINPLDTRFRPTGWRWLPIEPFTILTPSTGEGWTVRVSAPAIEQIGQARAQALPAETGGYLYGAWDPNAKVITITSATTLPPGSTATPTSLVLGPAGMTAEERRLVRKSRGRIYLCGTWHSHPSGSARMSRRDYETMERHHARDVDTLSPTLIVIAAEDEILAHIKLP